jgi:MoaA/NifB/PqqE/SkfB family radical SAM enzyme
MPLPPPGSYFNVPAFRRLLRSYSGHPLVVRLMYFSLRRGLPLIRKFKPLFGATALVALTYRCQCSCRHCGAGLFRREGQDELSKDEVFQLLRDLREGGGSGVHFFGGEPMLAGDVAAYAAEATRLGLRSALGTNGLLIDKPAAAKLAAAGIKNVDVSLDSPDEAMHDEFRGVPGAWRKAVDALRFCRAEGIPVYINYYASRDSLGSDGLDGMIALADGLGAMLRILPPVQAGRWKDRADIPLSPRELDGLRLRLKPGKVCWGYEFIDRPGAPFLCHSFVRSTFDVSPYGDVLACPYLSRSFGNIRRVPLAQAAASMWAFDTFSLESGYDGCPLNAATFLERRDRYEKGDSR